MQWEDVPETIEAWAVKVAAPCWDIKAAAADVWTTADLGYYFNPVSGQAAIYAPETATPADRALCKSAAERAVGYDFVRPAFLTYQELADPDNTWVKVAYSPLIRNVGEALNFFPGHYPGGIPNHASPLASMLTSGLVGAGLGWGGGKLAEKWSPSGYGKKLGRTGAILGGLLGAAPGAIWAATNAANDKGITDPWPMTAVGAPAEPDPEFTGGTDSPHAAPEAQLLPETIRNKLADPLPMTPYRPSVKTVKGCDLNAIVLGERWKTAAALAVKEAFDTFAPGGIGPRPMTEVDVNIDALGRTLWDTGASPNLAASTMSAMFAAQQLPSQRAREGWATGDQLGQLAMNAAGDYARGSLVGAAINAVIGTPYSADQIGKGNVVLGVLGTVIPKLFGR